MKYKLLVSDEAILDIEFAIETYTEVPSEGLENRFKEKLKNSIDYITENPLGLREKYRGVRIHNLESFPYQVHFLVQEDKVMIIGVFHGRSNPKSWTERLK